jgi:hypothetical protein
MSQLASISSTSSESTPVSDVDAPPLVCHVQSARGSGIFTGSTPPPLPPFSDPSFQYVFDLKIGICSSMFDFTDTEPEPMKGAKTDALGEFVNFLQGSGIVSIPPLYIENLFEMAALNVLREDPIFPTAGPTQFYAHPIVEPAMPHLVPCYRILSRIVDSFPRASFLRFPFAHRLLFLTQLPDARERNLIADLLKRYFMVRTEQQIPFIRALTSHLIMIRDGSLIPLAAPPLLLVAASCIATGLKRFPKEILPLIHMGVFPLVSHPELPIFLSAMKLLLAQVLFTELPELAIPFALRLQNTWPVLSGSKEVSYADLLVTIAPVFPAVPFGRISKGYFGFLLQLLQGPNHQVAMTVMSIYERTQWIELLATYGRAIVPMFYPVLLELSGGHWNNGVREKSRKIVAMMEKESAAETAKLRKASYGQGRGQEIGELDDARVRRWFRIIDAVATSARKQTLMDKVVQSNREDPDPKRMYARFIARGQLGEEGAGQKPIEVPRALSFSMQVAGRGPVAKLPSRASCLGLTLKK